MRPRLVLVSGSREWPREAIGQIGERLLPIAQRDNRIVLLHGGAKRGVDQLAHSLWTTWGMVDPWVIDAPWDGPCALRIIDPLTGAPFCQPGHRKRRRRHSGGQAGSGDYCPRAGHRRNQWMVTKALEHGDAVAEVFIRDASPGATDCAARCQHAGLPFTVTCYAGTTS